MENTQANYQHWKTKLDSDGILWLCLDRADKNVNSLSREVLEELEDLLDAISQKSPSGVIIYSGKPGGFIVRIRCHGVCLHRRRFRSTEIYRVGP